MDDQIEMFVENVLERIGDFGAIVVGEYLRFQNNSLDVGMKPVSVEISKILSGYKVTLTVSDAMEHDIEGIDELVRRVQNGTLHFDPERLTDS